MLTEDDKTRLKLEEEFRHEIRKALEQRQPPPSLFEKMRLIINSPFGIFFLSTVVIGFLSWSYARWDATQKAAAQNKETMRKLYIEIPYRIKSARRASDVADWGPQGVTRSMKAALEQLRGTKSIFPEFEGRPLFLLLFELRSVVPEGKRQEVNRVYANSLALYDLEPILLEQKSEEETKYEDAVEKEHQDGWRQHQGDKLKAKGQAIENFESNIWPELMKAEEWKIP